MFVIWCTRQVFTEPKTIVHVGSQDHGLGLSHLVCSLPSPCYTKWNGVWFVLHFLSETIFLVISPRSVTLLYHAWQYSHSNEQGDSTLAVLWIRPHGQSSMDGIRSLYTGQTISFGNVHLYIIFQGDSHNLIVTTLAC